MYDFNGNEVNPAKESRYKGKRFSILGDSISTFAGYIPAGNAVYYTGSNAGVSSVNDLWWKKLITALGGELLVNESWSGSRVSGTISGSSSAGCDYRCTKLHTSTADPDVIIVYMGINDFNNGVGIGSYNGSQTFPTSGTTFREAYAIMLGKILNRYKRAEVWVCTLPYCERSGAIGFPEINTNAVKLATWNDTIREMAALFGVHVIENACCGLTYQNMDVYMGDWDGGTQKGLHPNASGHSLIADNAIRTMQYEV